MKCVIWQLNVTVILLLIYFLTVAEVFQTAMIPTSVLWLPLERDQGKSCVCVCVCVFDQEIKYLSLQVSEHEHRNKRGGNGFGPRK